MGKNLFSFRRSIARRQSNKKAIEPPLLPLTAPPGIEVVPLQSSNDNAVTATGPTKVKKKTGGARLWMRFSRDSQPEVSEWDKSAIINHVSIPARDLRILGPIFSHSSSILARERAMVVNLEFIRAIVTAEEVLLLDPLCHEVVPFVEQLRRQLHHKGPSKSDGRVGFLTDAQDNETYSPTGEQWASTAPETVENRQLDLPFEFQVLESALEFVCSYFDSSVADLEKNAYPVLDELARNVSTKNLERVRSLKSTLTRLLARVQKVRDEIEHLLDDNQDMAQLYLSRKLIQNQQAEALLTVGALNAHVPAPQHFARMGSCRSGSLVTSNYFDDDDDVEELEMLLEVFFMQLDRTRNKILSVREYIDDTEDYVNIQLDNQRNELIQLQLTLTIASFAIAVETLIAGIFGMNIPCSLYDVHGIFELVVGSTMAFCVVLFILILGYARWKKLLGS